MTCMAVSITPKAFARSLIEFAMFSLNDTAATTVSTLSLHDALPILVGGLVRQPTLGARPAPLRVRRGAGRARSEEHTSELQSRLHLVCRLLLEKKKQEPQTHGDALRSSHLVQQLPGPHDQPDRLETS